MKTFIVSYPSAKPPATSHIHHQIKGALCLNLQWDDQSQLVIEQWQFGDWHPDLYPVLDKHPFDLWNPA